MKSKPTLKPAEVNSHSRQLQEKNTSDPMEVESFGKKGKKGKKGKGDGKSGKKEGQHQNRNPNPSKDVVCWHCEKKGHLSTERWSNPKNQSGSSGTQNEGGKGKPKNVTGKEAGSFGEQAAVVKPQPQPALASSLDLASIETPVRSPHPDHEGWLRWTQVRRFRHFRWMQGLALKRRRMTVTARQLQVNSFPTVEASARTRKDPSR